MLVLIGIALGKCHPAGKFLCQLFNDWRNTPARPAPLCPEIDDEGRVFPDNLGEMALINRHDRDMAGGDGRSFLRVKAFPERLQLLLADLYDLLIIHEI